jgi:glycosyltransferase involved in cell wall biosynthesis
VRILLANKYFYPRGGSERYLFALDRLLRGGGHETVHFATRDERNAATPYSDYFVEAPDFSQLEPSARALPSVVRMFGSRKVRASIGRLIEDTRPDVAIVNNVYHQLGPSVVLELERRGVPAVMVLHDYKVVCPAYALLRDGRPCEDCAGGAFHWALLRGCGGSRARGAVLTAESVWQHRVLRSYDRVARFIAPSRFLLDKVRTMGFTGPISLLRNFVRPAPKLVDAAKSRVVGFSGRLSGEKGLQVLIAAAKKLPEVQFRVAGDGPLRPELEALLRAEDVRNLEILGHLSEDALKSEMSGWRVMVTPSLVYENCPLAILEAQAMGLPVIGSRLGGITELLEGGSGVLVPPGDAAALAKRIEELAADDNRVKSIGESGASLVRRYCRPDRYLKSIEHLLRQVRRAGETP